MNTRHYRAHEIFELTCHQCHRLIQLPMGAVKGDIAHCPRCGARLTLQWREAP